MGCKKQKKNCSEMATSLYPQTTKKFTCTVHPVVLFSVLDFYTRREDGDRVIGVLLGEVDEANITITNCFPVPHREGAKIALDREFYNTMITLHEKSNPKEMLVGWYSTGLTINDASVLFHEFFTKDMRRSPIHLLVDTEFTDGEMAIKAFVHTAISLEKKKFASRFDEIYCQVEALDAESMALTSFASADDEEERGRVALSSDIESLRSIIKKLKANIAKVRDYVDKVVKGETKPSKKVGRMLTRIVQSVPKIDETAYTKMFNDNLQDLLMVVYLANLTSTQLEIAEKLQTLA